MTGFSSFLRLNNIPLYAYASVQFSHSVVSNSLWPYGLQHARLSCPSPTPGAFSNSCPSIRRCHPTISSSVIPFSSCLQSCPASGSFPVSRLFASGSQSIMTLTVLKSTGLSLRLLWVRPMWRVWRRTWQTGMSFSFCHVGGSCHQCDLSLVKLTWYQSWIFKYLLSIFRSGTWLGLGVTLSESWVKQHILKKDRDIRSGARRQIWWELGGSHSTPGLHRALEAVRQQDKIREVIRVPTSDPECSQTLFV